VMSAYESRENVIEAGQRGSSDAVAASELTKSLEKRQMSRLKAEVIGDMRKLSGKKLSKLEEAIEDKDHGDTHEMSFEEKIKAHKDSKELSEIDPGKDPHAVPGQQGEHLKAHLAKIGECLAKGDVEGAKAAHEELCKYASSEPMADKKLSLGDVPSEDQQKNMGDVQSQVDELNTQMARLSGMVEELMSVEKEEGHELEEGGEESPEDKEKKQLSEEIKEDKAKEA